MQKCFIRFAVSFLAFATGTGATEISNNLIRWARWRSVQPQLVAEFCPSDQPELRSLSPYDIKTFINEKPRGELIELWQLLKIPNPISGLGGQWFPARCEACEAEVFEYDLDAQPGNEALLRIADQTSRACRYLVFKWANNSWIVFGHIDFENEKYRMPQHTVVLSGGKTWLVIKGQGASGSGVASYYDRVFLVTPEALIDAFSYVSEGSQYGMTSDANREFNARILSCALANDVITVEIEYSVTYVGGANALFTRKQKAAFSKRLGSQTQLYDAEHSDLSQNELETVYNVDSLSYEGFLKYNYRELSQIVAGDNAPNKEWLREFLENRENTVEGRRLNRLLAQ